MILYFNLIPEEDHLIEIRVGQVSDRGYLQEE